MYQKPNLKLPHYEENAKTPRSKFLSLKCSYHQGRGQEERAQLSLHSARPHALRNAAVHVHAPAQPPLSIHICNPT